MNEPIGWMTQAGLRMILTTIDIGRHHEFWDGFQEFIQTKERLS
ncbi:hypothetical protein [Mitsuokella jalaludinii]